VYGSSGIARSSVFVYLSASLFKRVRSPSVRQCALLARNQISEYRNGVKATWKSLFTEQQLRNTSLLIETRARQPTSSGIEAKVSIAEDMLTKGTARDCDTS
jgi:hypothetical protein